MHISVIVVNWNTAGPLTRALDSLALAPGITWEVIVIDNASSDDSVARLRRDYPQVHLIANPDNRGFGRACNQGFAIPVETRAPPSRIQDNAFPTKGKGAPGAN